MTGASIGISPIERLFSKVNKRGPIPAHNLALGRCWVWQGTTNGKGYGKIYVGDRDVYVHRFSYEQHQGPIPAGLVIDHLCRNRACIRPSHLEPKTALANLLAEGSRIRFNGADQRAKTHCKNGHEFSSENTYITPSGSRACRTCKRIVQREYEIRKQRRLS